MLLHHFGTALTQQQGWLLRKNSSQIILSFDSDSAGLQAKIRALDILQNMGCDIRVLQMEGAKDPDEFIIKYGNIRFKNVVDNALSVIEFKVKLLKQNLDLNNTSDKIKFLNEIAKLISKIDNNIEREIYIEKIAQEYEISKEAIYAEVNKLTYTGNQGEKILDKPKPVVMHKKIQNSNISEATKRRENTVLAILLMGDLNIFQIIKQNINPEDFKDELNKEIAKIMYEEFEKGNSNINSILDKMDEEEQSHITEILADDYELDDVEKAIDDVMQSYEKEKLTEQKMDILEKLEKMDNNTNSDEKNRLELELMNIINRLAKMK